LTSQLNHATRTYQDNKDKHDLLTSELSGEANKR